MFFRRKNSAGSGGSDSPREGSSPLLDAGAPRVRTLSKPAVPEGFGSPTTPAVKAPVPPARSEMPRRVIDIPTGPRRNERAPMTPAEGKKLTVGRDICLNGRISACERLVVEGQVEAELTDCRIIEIADSGTFKGSAEVDSAEISGRFEGSLTVRERLLIRSAGRISGTVRYGRLEIEQGGEINGDVKSLGAGSDSRLRREPGPALDAAPPSPAIATAGIGEG
jgi:cytoskeletal protein CcmA (bactofilin family)